MRAAAQDPPYEVVVFDCDSTLSSVEGIEELTREFPEVAELTAAAMDGAIPLEAVYGKRLELVKPTRAQVEAVTARYAETALPGAAELIGALRWLGKEVAVLSGGLLPPVRAFSETLGVDPARVHAVDIHFDGDGGYAGFESDSPLARAGGKPELVERLFPGRSVCHIGDGATDLEVQDVCARFIAFTAVERRTAVAEAADVEVGEADLTALAPFLLSPGEFSELAAESEWADWARRAGEALR